MSDETEQHARRLLEALERWAVTSGAPTRPEAAASYLALLARITALEQSIEQREEMATHWLARANELELEELPALEDRVTVLTAALEQIARAYEYDDDCQAYSLAQRARVALAEKRP